MYNNIISSVSIIFNRSSIPKSSGPILSIGESLPSKTKYLPRKPPVDSIARTSEGLSTTHMLFESLEASEQMSHIDFDVNILHLEHL